MRPAHDLAIAAALGAAQTLALVHTWAWPLPLAGMAWLAWRCGRVAPRRAAVLGLGFGTAWLAAAVWWLFVSMHRYGGLPAPLAAAGVAALSLSLSAYLALAMAGYARWRCGRARLDVPLFAAVWLLAELARGQWFTGFPWAATGYSQVDAPLAALAPWVGVYGVGAAAAALAALSVRGVRGLVAAAAALAALAVLPVPSFTRPAGSLDVVLLQTSVPQDQKFAIEQVPHAMKWVADELAARRGQLAVAPETAVPLLPQQLQDLAPGYWSALRDAVVAGGRAALLGLPLGDFDAGYTNSVVGFAPGRPDHRYDKWHLVPFGEFIPAGFRWFTEMMDIPLGDFARGTRSPPPFVFAGQRLAPNICYEDLFGEELARRFANAADAPTMLVNLSNIAWFGDTIAIEQHLNISRLRSLELQRPMLRSTNTGATAVIDHRGRVTARLPSQVRAVLEARAEGRDGRTPYAAWAASAGLLPLWLAAVAVVGVAALARRPPPAAAG